MRSMNDGLTLTWGPLRNPALDEVDTIDVVEVLRWFLEARWFRH